MYIYPQHIKASNNVTFFSTGFNQTSVGNDFNLGLSQSIVSIILEETLDVLQRVICPLFIKFEMTEEEKSECKLEFFEKIGFPSVIGCVDGTHIKILTPSKQEQNMHFNRK